MLIGRFSTRAVHAEMRELAREAGPGGEGGGAFRGLVLVVEEVQRHRVSVLPGRRGNIGGGP